VAMASAGPYANLHTSLQTDNHASIPPHQACKLNREDATDRIRWMNQIRDD